MRPRCHALIDDIPTCTRFRPCGGGNGKTILTFEELEALRWKDREGLDQEEAADQMGLTRPTFQRLLQSARYKVALALTSGHTLLIEGGCYKMANRTFVCVECQHQWEEAPCNEGGRHGYEIQCPKCGSLKKRKIQADGSAVECGGHGHSHQHGQGSGCGCKK